MSQVSISDSGGPGDCRSGVFIAEEGDGVGDGVGDRSSGDIRTANVGTLLEESRTLDCSFSTAKF